MSGIDVDLSVLATIAGGLDSGASGLEGLAGGVPSGVDAGPMSAVVASMLSQVVDSAGNVSVALTGAADSVRRASYFAWTGQIGTQLVLPWQRSPKSAWCRLTAPVGRYPLPPS